MTALCVIFTVIALVLFLLFLPIHLKISYDGELSLKLSVLFLVFKLYPRQKKISLRYYSKKNMDKRRRKEERKNRKAPKKAKQISPQPPPKKKTVKDHLRTLKLILMILKKTQKRVRGAFRLRISRFYVLVATGDAASTALLYGGVSQSCAYILALIEKTIKTSYKKQDVIIVPDYRGNETKFFIKLQLRTDILHLLAAALSALIAYFSSQKTINRGGTKNG